MLARSILTLLIVGCHTGKTVLENDGPVQSDTGLSTPQDTGEDSSPDTAEEIDADGDGYTEDIDCDDSDASVYPDAEEVCDGQDNNCDGQIDEGLSLTWYADFDGDGFGDSETTAEACAEPSGYLSTASDCDDADPDINPDASERCDGVDNDCDGTVDEDDATDVRAWYRDSDSDGFGHADDAVIACDAPAGYTEDGSDCDDTEIRVNPDAIEFCDEIDNNCDGIVDEDAAVDAPTWYADLDGDGYGDPERPHSACSAPEDHIEDDTDCHDTEADAFPGSTATETPTDGIDTDCDGIDACTDLNCDGIPDLAIGTYYSGSAYSSDSLLFYGSGTEFSDSDVDAIPGTGTYDALAEDLDGDGYIDLVMASYYTDSTYYADSYVYWGGPEGYSAERRDDLPTGGVRSVIAEDFNGDDYVDLAFVGHYVGSYYTYTYVYYGGERGYSSGALDTLYAPGGIRSKAADLDGDGDTDLVVCRHYAYAYDVDSYIYWNDGSGFNDTDRTDLTTYGCFDLEIEDLDSDGWQDIVFASYSSDADFSATTSQIYWGSSDGYSEEDLTELPTVGTLSVAPGDYNGDGYRDLAFGSYYSGSSYSSSAIVYYGSESGYDETDHDTLASTGSYQIQSGDLNLDGYDELVLPSYYSDAGYSGGSYVYYGDAAGIGGSPDVLPTSGVSDVGIGDLDGNGYPELVFNHYYSGSWSTLVGSTIYWGDGGGYGSSESTELETAPQPVVQAHSPSGSMSAPGAASSANSRRSLRTGSSGSQIIRTLVFASSSLSVNVISPNSAKCPG
jgi:hypothetical protein